MTRNACLVLGVAMGLAIACGGGGGSAPPAARESGPGAEVEIVSPEVPAPPEIQEPTPAPSPPVSTERWESEAALYLSPPADGVLRPVADLPCREHAVCPQIVLIGCTGTTLRDGRRITGENLCRNLPGSAATIGDFVVRTEGTFDPETGRTDMHGTAEVGDGFAYDYAVSVWIDSEAGTMTGSGEVGQGWPLVITGVRVE